MKKFLFYSLILLSILSQDCVHAQNIFYSKDQKFTFQNSDFNVVGWSGDRLYTYRASKEGYYLDAYNDSMRLLATVALDFFPKKIYETKFFVTNNQIIVLYQAVQSNQVVQYAAKLDSRARLLSKPMALDSVKMGWMASARQYYSSEISNDRSKLMVYRISNQKNNKQEFKTILMDDNLNVLAKGSPFIKADENFNLGQSVLSNDGILYLATFSGDNSKSMSGDAWMISIAANGNNINYVKLPLSNNYITGMYLQLDDASKNVYIGGFYAPHKSGNLEGVVYGLYQADEAKFTNFKILPFDEQLRVASDEANKKRAFNDYDVKKIIVKKDGGFILVSENSYVSVRNSMYPGSGYGYYDSYYSNTYDVPSTREYHYGNIMTLAYDVNGVRQWQNFIRKEQYTIDDAGLMSSYAMINSGASLVFLYNDFSSSKTTLNLAAIDAEGNVQLKKLNSGRIIGTSWIPRSAKQTDLRELVVPVLRKGTVSFARVVF